jgi:hypothetical protein
MTDIVPHHLCLLINRQGDQKELKKSRVHATGTRAMMLIDSKGSPEECSPEILSARSRAVVWRRDYFIEIGLMREEDVPKTNPFEPDTMNRKLCI